MKNCGIILNADVNGAIGIMRKVVGDVSWRPADSVVALNPVMIRNCHTKLSTNFL